MHWQHTGRLTSFPLANSVHPFSKIEYFTGPVAFNKFVVTADFMVIFKCEQGPKRCNRVSTEKHIQRVPPELPKHIGTLDLSVISFYFFRC